jgi:hypothetical protein
MEKASCRQRFYRRAIHLLAGIDRKSSRDHGNELVLRMTVGRDDEAGGEFEADRERSLLDRATVQDGALGTEGQRRRGRAPHDGIAGHHCVVSLGLRLQGAAEERRGAKGQGNQADHDD